MDSREESIFKTLLYSDLFDYPLTESEIHKFLIAQKIEKNELSKILKNGKLPIQEDDNFFFIKGRGKIVNARLSKEKFSLEKLEKAKKITRFLGLIPTIKLIGVSGTLAMKNCSVDDDIDLFIIAKNGLAWTTRFIAVLILIMLGVYRNKNSTMNKNKICLNLVLDENKMQFKNQDLFIGHEIVQLLPIFERDRAYQKFIKANIWIDKIFPNFKINDKTFIKKRTNLLDQLSIFICKIIYLEKLLRSLQLFYMKKSITKERLERGFIGLHPFDYRSYILEKYNAKIRKIGLK
jgi:D-beta-D-heptose 7-phosphate kinase/D-beta-D-heptose 1-phosphate adenosyltransferase